MIVSAPQSYSDSTVFGASANYSGRWGFLLSSLWNESVEVVGTVATVAWSIWQNRNSWLWNGDKDTAKGVAIKVAHLIGEWRAINELQ
ncbi:hypothetical protein QL285_017476 [Trifolium repens]|nr:hypothetical protein QL285_017476 [Trifolium repens]